MWEILVVHAGLLWLGIRYRALKRCSTDERVVRGCRPISVNECRLKVFKQPGAGVEHELKQEELYIIGQTLGQSESTAAGWRSKGLFRPATFLDSVIICRGDVLRHNNWRQRTHGHVDTITRAHLVLSLPPTTRR